jgi:hypothetical protein
LPPWGPRPPPLASGKSVTVKLVLADSQLTTASGISYTTTEWLDL